MYTQIKISILIVYSISDDTFPFFGYFCFQIFIPLELSEHHWSLALQQVLLFVLIIGRWMLPKGELTRDQLSQLLLVYIGIAADILEFSTEGLKMEETRCNAIMVIWILGIWTWSLLQFTLGLTVTKSRKRRLATSNLEPRMNIMCCETEVWGIMATVIMQDGPFLALRMYVLIQFEAFNQMMIFFTAKNTLVILLQLYRLVVIFLKKPGHDPNGIIGRINRYRRPGSRYHSGGGSMNNGHGFGGSHGMPSESASTNKLLNLDLEAAVGTPTHMLPLLPDTLDGPFRHSVNMSSPQELNAHTPSNIERFPSHDIAFIVGRTLPNDVVPIRNHTSNLEVDESPNRRCSDYENMNTPNGSIIEPPDDDEDAAFMVPDFPDLPSVFDSDEENLGAAEAKEDDTISMISYAADNDDGKKDGKKKGKKKKDKKKDDKTKEEKKKEKDEKKREEEKKKEEKRKDEERRKEEKKAAEEKKKEEKRLQEEKKKEEKRLFEEKKKESKKAKKLEKKDTLKRGDSKKDDTLKRGNSSKEDNKKVDKKRGSKKKADKKKGKEDEKLIEEDIQEETVEDGMQKTGGPEEVSKAEGGNIAEESSQIDTKKGATGEDADTKEKGQDKYRKDSKDNQTPDGESKAATPPEDASENPATSKENPAATKEKPAASKEKPSASKEEPAASKEKPAASKEKPAASKEKPAASKEKPAASKEKPAASKEKPAASKEKPAASKEKPAASKEKPAASQEKPAASIEKPAASKEKPAASKEKPSVSKEKPAASKEKPSASKEKPSASKEKPTASKPSPLDVSSATTPSPESPPPPPYESLPPSASLVKEDDL